jgi:hypothetical protein
MLWSGTIGFFASNYLVLAVVSLIESNDLRFGRQHNATENFCSLVACVGVAFSIAFPSMITYLYLRELQYVNPKVETNSKILQLATKYKGPGKYLYLVNLEDEQFLQVALLESEHHKKFMFTYGLLVVGLRLKRQGALITTLTPVIDLLMKLLIAVGVTRLYNSPLGVIFLFNFVILTNLQFILNFQPYEDKWDQARLIFNAMTYLALNYHLFLFTDFVDYQTYPVIASSAIYLIWTNIAANVILTVPNLIINLSTKLKLLYKRR